MSTAIMIIAHNDIGQALIDTATSMLDNKTTSVTNLSIPVSLEPQDLGYHADRVHDSIAELSIGNSVLILTDIYGATANNLARYFADQENVEVVSGLNLPMLIRVLNYNKHPLEQLAVIALEGGRKGIQ
ncbi:MAG: PTS fructose transporter subunit IIA [Gammaproteobacteria bacterium]|nr:PTS fructose transporter subunit IIA [Gammaproteobacteria bacterium]